VSRQRWLIPVVVVVLSVTAGGGLLAREFYQRQLSAEPRGTESIVAPSSTTPLAPDQEPGSDTVLVSSDVAIHPQGGAVRTVLQNYFSSINTRNYKLWTSTVSAKRAGQKPEKVWQQDLQSTKDGSVLVYRIERGAGVSLRVLLGFTSTQNVGDAPEDFPEKCIHWRLVWPLIEQNGSLRIDTVESPSDPEREKC
jgi:hypothetical protein